MEGNCGARALAQIRGYGILTNMSPGTKSLLERVERWPEEDQQELADVAREIESRRSGVYRLSDEERAAVRAGMAEARNGDFVPEEEMEDFYRTHRGA